MHGKSSIAKYANVHQGTHVINEEVLRFRCLVVSFLCGLRLDVTLVIFPLLLLELSVPEPPHPFFFFVHDGSEDVAQNGERVGQVCGRRRGGRARNAKATPEHTKPRIHPPGEARSDRTSTSGLLLLTKRIGNGGR